MVYLTNTRGHIIEWGKLGCTKNIGKQTLEEITSHKKVFWETLYAGIVYYLWGSNQNNGLTKYTFWHCGFVKYVTVFTKMYSAKSE